MKEEKELHLDFCEECFQMTNHLGDECLKCKAKKEKKDQNEYEDDEYEY